MVHLILCILFTTVIFIIFRLFRTYRIETFQAIVVNYVTASLCAFFFKSVDFDFQNIFEKQWIYLSLFLGLLFISVFYIMALTTQKYGVSVASVISKMSLVIPVVAAYYLYADRFNWVKVIGIFMALAAVYLINIRKENNKELGIRTKAGILLLPVALFFGNGLIDTMIKFSQALYIPPGENEFFISSLFGTAAIIGLLSLVYRKLARGKKFERKSLAGGFILGIINFFSLFYLLKALDVMESSVVYPLLNVGIVFLSAVAGFFMFKEHLSVKNIIGIACAIVAIIFIASSEIVINYVSPTP
ncbi:MAG: EamA family transporter [Bacteroidia bacterium]